MVTRNLFLLLFIDCSLWPSLNPAKQDLLPSFSPPPNLRGVIYLDAVLGVVLLEDVDLLPLHRARRGQRRVVGGLSAASDGSGGAAVVARSCGHLVPQPELATRVG